MLLKEHYALLGALILRGNTGVALRYNTNLSRLSFGRESVTRYWKHFPRVGVGASIDASGARGEYIRKGMVWGEIVANRKRLQREAPHVSFWLAPTVQAMNALCLPELHLEWIREGLARPQDIHFNLVDRPSFLSLQILTPGLKRKFREVWMDYVSELGRFPGTEGVVAQALQVVEFAFLEQSSVEARRQFAEHVRAFDRLRGESFGDVFPELKELLDHPRQETAALPEFPNVLG
jgi:hypothetical protein